jgi:hypothetical protein
MYGFTQKILYKLSFNLYLNVLKTLRSLDLKKTAVVAAYFMENHSKDVNNSRMFDAAQFYLYSGETGLPTCNQCFLPILSDVEHLHKYCRIEFHVELEEEELYREAVQANQLWVQPEDQKRLVNGKKRICHEPDCNDSFSPLSNGCVCLPDKWPGK